MPIKDTAGTGPKYVTNTDEVTGSFAYIQIVEGPAATTIGTAAKFTDIQWGKGDLNLGSDHATVQTFEQIADANITGSIILGPIIGFRLANGAVLAYYG